MGFLAPSPPPIPKVGKPPIPASQADPTVALAASQQRSAAAGGFASTIATSPQGVSTAPTTSQKTLLGQ